MSKVCIKCGADKELEEFYKVSSKGNKLLRATCKRCMNLKSNKYQKTPHGRNSTNKASSKYRRTKKGKEVDSKRYWNAPEKVRARANLKYHLDKGHIQKEPCFCGETKVEGHHEDYSKPLDVEWLCKKHHTEKERK